MLSYNDLPQRLAIMEEKDLFPHISGFTLPKESESVLRSQNVNLSQYQKEINDDIAAGGERKNRRLQHTFGVLDKVLGGTYYSQMLESTLPATQREVADSFGNTTGKQNFFGQFYNSSVPALIEGVGKLGAAIPALFETDNKDWNARNKSVEDWVRPMLTYIDDSFANATPVFWDKNKGEVDFSNLTSGAAWANTTASLLGFMAPVFATVGFGALVRGASVGGKVAAGLGALSEVAETAAGGAKLDAVGRAMLAVEFTSSTAMMFPEYQKMGMDNGLSIGQATKVALPLAIINGAIELLGGVAMAKGLGFTTADANKVIREVTRQNADNVLAGLKTGAKLDETAFHDIIEQVAKSTVHSLADKSQHPLWKRMASRVGKAYKEQGIAEGAEEFLQSSTEELSKVIYNSTADPSLPEGRGRFAKFSAGEYATNAIFGTLLGKLMGTSMGLLHKNPKAFDQTLFNYVAADVNSQMANGATDVESILPNLKAYAIAQKGMDDGHFDDTEREKINAKISNMAQVAFEFADAPEIGKSERYAMFRLTQTGNELTDRAVAVGDARQTVTDLQQQINSGTLSPKALIDANAALNQAQSQLGAYDPETDAYEAETQLEVKNTAIRNILQQVGSSMADAKNRSVATRFLKNELSVINEEPAAAEDFAADGQTLVIKESGQGGARLRMARLIPVPTASLSEDLEFTQDAYTPSVRAAVEPAEYFSSVTEYEAAEAVYSDGKRQPAADLQTLTQSPAADAADVLTLGKDMVASAKQRLMPEADTPIEQQLAPLYSYYQQIEDYDTDGKAGVQKFDSYEKFLEALGVVPEEAAVEAAEAGVEPETLTAEPQPATLANLPPEQLQAQAAATNEFYDETLVQQQIDDAVRANGIEPQISIPDWVDIAIRRAENALPMAPSAIKEASDYLYKLYRQWNNMKKSSSRLYTVEQINEMTELIGEDIELLQQFLNAYEEGNEAEFAGRNQAPQTQPDAAAAVPAAEPGTPNAEPNASTDSVNGNAQTDPAANPQTGETASTLESDFAQEQERSAAVESVAAGMADALAAAQQLEQHTQSLIGADDATVTAKLDAAESALRSATEGVQRLTESLGAVDQNTAQQPGNQGEVPGVSDQIETQSSKAVRRKLEKLRRTPRSFLEGVLWYFGDGGRLRREDFVRLAGEGALRSQGGGNTYLSYVADSALPYDQVLSNVVVDLMGYDFVEDFGDETALLNELIDTVLSFSSLSPQRQLLKLLAREEQTAAMPFTSAEEAAENALHGWAGEALLEKLSVEDREAFAAFLQTLPDNIDLTNPDVLFEALVDYQRNGFPPMSPEAMDLLTVVTYDFVFDGQFSPAFQQEFQPIIEQYNESVQQNDPRTESAGNAGTGNGTGTTESAADSTESGNPGNSAVSAAAAATDTPRTSADGGTKTSRRGALDERAKALRQSLADDWDAFVSPGDTLNASLIGITPKQFEAAARMVGNLAELGINRFEDAMLEIMDILGPEKAAAGFKAFKAAYMAVKANDEDTNEDLNALRKTTFEQINQLYNDVSTAAEYVESDSARGTAAESVGESNVSGLGVRYQPPSGNGGTVTGESGDTFESDSSVPAGTSVTVGSEGDPDLYPQESNDVIEGRAAGFGERQRGGELDGSRLSTEPRGERPTLQPAATDNSRSAKIQRQKDAANVEITGSELDNIQATLPYLLAHQHTNVQKAEVRLLEQNEKGILFTDGTGTGKAQPLWAKILTPSGWKTMGNLSIGDSVISVDGTPTYVTGVFDRGVKEVFRVKFSDGGVAFCCDEHLWETQTIYERRKSRANPDWLCAKPKVRSLNEIRNSLEKDHFIPITAPIQFPENNYFLHPYIIGVLIGDGSLAQKTVSFTNHYSDVELASRVESLLPNGYSLVHMKSKDRCDEYVLKDDFHIKDGGKTKYRASYELERLGLRFKKSFEKRIPNEYLFGSIEQRLEMLRGMMDTDGWVCKKTKTPYVTTTSFSLANDIIHLVRSLGGLATIGTKIPSFTHNGEKRKGREAYTLCINLPEGLNPFALTRKAELYRPNYKYPPKRKIVSVELFSQEQVRCIAVEHERHLYITDDFAVTHNTMTALGIAYRFLKRGKKNILIVTPSDKKVKDWVEEAGFLGIAAKGLTGLNDKGEGVSATTYANFGQNQEIAKRTFDLIIYDESHNLISNESGSGTLAYSKHRDLAKPALDAYYAARREYEETLDEARKKRNEANDNRAKAKFPFIKEEVDKWNAEYTKWNKVVEDIEDNKIPKRAEQLVNQTKVVFLSATPFAYHKNIRYADGFLFKAYQQLGADFKPLSNSGGGYNSGDEMDKYMMAAFGYRMRYNKLTAPEAGVDQGLMERNWLESLKASGAVSATKLDIPQDYSREFVLLSEEGQSSPIGLMIDEGLRIINDSEEFKFLSRAVNKHMDYLYKNRLLEQIKAKLGIERIRKHLEENRKVVIFHTYNEGITSHPFDFNYLGDPEFVEKMGNEVTVAAQEARLFQQMYPQYRKIDLRGLTNVPQAIQNAFGEEVVLFNGAIPKAQRAENIKKFNDDNSSVSIIVVNIAAGEAGLNLHDTTGGNQRVLIQLGLPIRPTSAIQSEGRIYRTGQLSNAVFEYFVTHFNFEKYAFGSKINERSGTAENLAMGNEARDLKVSFKEGYLNPTDADPSTEQGVGGKQNDYTRGSMTLMQKAMTYYWARQKKTAKTKSREGVDYFATPEPLGLKKVQWLHARPGDSLLEPSAGHGAIARWFPDSTSNVMIEPSTELRSDLSVNAHGSVIGGTFEQLSIVNKFRGIAMNPPFGTAGKTALEHVAKAIRHLENEGRIVATVPTGSFDTKFEKYFYGVNEKGRYENPEAEYMHLTARILLPSVTFERAGTAVNAQILVLDKQVISTERQKMPPTRTIDLRGIDNINDFFERIEGIDIAPIVVREAMAQETAPVAQPPQGMKPLSVLTESRDAVIPKAEAAAPDPVNNPVHGKHTRNGNDIFIVQTSGRLSSEEYARIREISKNHSGYYSSYKDNKGAIPGFIFSTAEQANAFYKEITGKDAAAAPPTDVQMMFAPSADTAATPQAAAGGTSFENTVQLLSGRFEGALSFQTPTEAEFVAKQKELAPQSTQTAYGFYEPNARQVWLNPALATAETPIHEIAHPWVSWAKTARPDIYNRGIELVQGSAYMKQLFSDPNYRNLTLEQLADEALVRAIADQGTQFVTPIRQRSFGEWVLSLFDSLKEFLGLGDVDSETLSNMSLEEFAKRAAADLLAGNTDWAERPTAAGSLSDNALMGPLFAFGAPTYDFAGAQRPATTVYKDLQEHVDYALGLLSQSALYTPKSQWDSKIKREVEAVAARTGVEYTGDGEYKFDLSKSPDTAFLADGRLVRMDRFGQASNQKGLIATTFRNGFLKLYAADDIKGSIFRFIVDNLRGLMNIETVASLLDDGSGVITSLINDAKRVGGRNKAYVTNQLAPKRWKIAQLAKDFTTFQGTNTIHTVKRAEVETYAWDETSQEVIRRRVEIPLATAMSMVLTADTQESMGQAYGGTSLTLPDRFVDQNGDLIDFARLNPNATPAQLATMKKSVIFSGTKNVHRGAKLTGPALEKQGNEYREAENMTLLLSKKELDKLRRRFADGIGITSDAETEVFTALKDAFNDKTVREMLRTEHENFLNFGGDFATVPDYFPINSADGQTQINDRVRYRPALEDSQLLNERKGAPKAVYVGDALDTLEDYEYRVGNILEHGRLSHNITTIANALRTEIPDDPMVKQLSQWLLDRRELIEDWRGYKAARQDKHQWAKPINLILSRYTSSIFRLNFGMAFKQLATYYSATGQSMLKDEYLFKAQGYANVLRLARGMVTDTVTGAGGEVVEGTDVGFKDALGNDTVQAETLRELLGEHITDPAEKELHRRRYATVIERVLYAQNAYVGGVDFDKVTFNNKGYNLLNKMFGRADDWMENIGMAPMRISDRAVILSYYLAAKDQVTDEVAEGTVPAGEYEARVAEILESALYATNQMNKVADMTTMQTSTNWLTKLLGLYSGQTQKLLNVFMQAFLNSAQHPDDKAAKTRLRKAFISNVIVVPAYLATVTTGWAALKALANGDEPKSWEESREDFGWNLVRNMGSIVPGLAEQVVTTVISSVDNEPWNDSLLQYPGDDIVNATVESMVDMYQWGAAEDDRQAGKYADSFYYNLEKAFSGWTGTPKVLTRFVREHTTTDKDD